MTPFEIADSLLACLDSAYTGDAGKPATICHRPGQEALFAYGTGADECCSGLAWVRVASVEPVIDPQESEQAGYSPCDTSRFRVTLELGAARCNPFGTAGAGPTCDEWAALALRMDNDRAAMKAAVCCFGALPDVGSDQDVYRVLPGRWEPLDSSGGCAGGTMAVVVWTDCQDC